MAIVRWYWKRLLLCWAWLAVPCNDLQSLRLLKGDHGWIRTLLDEAENERMHLMRFIRLHCWRRYKPLADSHVLQIKK